MNNDDSKRIPKWLIYFLSFIGVIYLTYPSLGIFELIPDIIPIVGHLDEGAAAILVWQGISELMMSRKSRK